MNTLPVSANRIIRAFGHPSVLRRGSRAVRVVYSPHERKDTVTVRPDLDEEGRVVVQVNPMLTEMHAARISEDRILLAGFDDGGSDWDPTMTSPFDHAWILRRNELDRWHLDDLEAFWNDFEPHLALLDLVESP